MLIAVKNWVELSIGVIALAGSLTLPLRKLNRLLHGIRSDLDKVKGQVFNNGGSSLKDAVDRVEDRQVVIVDHLLQIDSDRAVKERVWNEWATKVSPAFTRLRHCRCNHPHHY
jgi:hypothetical protein